MGGNWFGGFHGPCRDDIHHTICGCFQRLSSRKCGRRAWGETDLRRTLHIVHHTIRVPIGTCVTEFFNCHGCINPVKKKKTRDHLMFRKRDVRVFSIPTNRLRLGLRLRRRFLGDRDFRRLLGDLFSRPVRRGRSLGCASKFTIPKLRVSSASMGDCCVSTY